MNNFNRNSGFSKPRNVQPSMKKKNSYTKNTQEKSPTASSIETHNNNPSAQSIQKQSSEVSSSDHRSPNGSNNKQSSKRPFTPSAAAHRQSVVHKEQNAAENRLNDLVNTASKQLNTSPEELKNAAQNGNMQKLFSQMSPSQAQQLQKILSDENAAKKLLSTPQAQALLRGISKNE